MDVQLTPALVRALAASVAREPEYQLYGTVLQGAYIPGRARVPQPALRRLMEEGLIGEWWCGQWHNPEQWRLVNLTHVVLNERGIVLAEQCAGKRCSICASARVHDKYMHQDDTRRRCADCGSEFDVRGGV